MKQLLGFDLKKDELAGSTLLLLLWAGERSSPQAASVRGDGQEGGGRRAARAAAPRERAHGDHADVCDRDSNVLVELRDDYFNARGAPEGGHPAQGVDERPAGGDGERGG